MYIVSTLQCLPIIVNNCTFLNSNKLSIYISGVDSLEILDPGLKKRAGSGSDNSSNNSQMIFL